MYNFDGIIKELEIVESLSKRPSIDEIISANSLLIRIGDDLKTAGEAGLKIALHNKVSEMRKKIKAKKI